jgi:acyl-CoA synthetase (AMP-forming)/AMP-acid ligase II
VIGAVLGSLLSETLSEHGDRGALAYEDAVLTFRELADAADRVARALALEPGERLAVVAGNVPALAIGMLAAWRAGAVAVPLNARLRRFELERSFVNVEPAAVVCVRQQGGFQLAREVADVARRTPGARVLVVVNELGAVVDCSPLQPASRSLPSGSDLAAVLYTSGSTGEPKGALVPQGLAGAMARNLADLLGPDATAPYGLIVPASHAFGLGCLLAGLLSGACAVLVDVTASLEPLLRALQLHRARVLHGSPALFGRLLRSAAKPPLGTGFTAGSLCPPGVLQAFDERGARLLNLYGMTEIGAASSCRPEDPRETRYTTVGRPLPGYELRTAGDEIQVRSDYLPDGYHGRSWGPDELSDDGWFRTGDVGAIDPRGNLTIAGRSKEVVHVGGFNVFPGEVETFLLGHSSIAQAAVIGVEHEVLGEALQAFVGPAAGQRIDPHEVIRFARAGIAGYKVPYAVQVVDELPLLPSGKADRRALADLGRRKEAVR